MSSNGGVNMLSGFTKTCKGLAVVLVCGHIIVIHIFPSSIIYVELIPARTIPYGWNLITASYIEQTTHGVVISTISLLFIGKLLEPVWGRREFLKFIFVVNFVTNVCVFVSAIFVYYMTLEEVYIYTPLSGFGGALSGLLVGVKQLIPDHELSPFKIKAKWAPSIMLLLSIVMSFFTVELATCVPILIFGTYVGWIYLRYFQKKLETKIKGDPSDEFAFSTFFPEFLRPLINPISSIFHQVIWGRSEVSIESKGYTVNMDALPGSDSIEASRRRQRGARALEERLAAERLKSIGRTTEPHATEKV
ncbi:rhomboid-like protein 19 [Rutidosis leptorrhynchoides]|uniref:rhomboid-like protein 19 n=1 Tax=Rutidosis leptorrhynchoides TaxID=125765 RepID=UPI003A9A0626